MTDLHAAVRAFVERAVLPQVEAWDRADDLPDAVLRELVGLGVTGALVPREFGGGGLGVAELAPVWRTLSHGWISLTGAINPTALATARRRRARARRREALGRGRRQLRRDLHARGGRRRAGDARELSSAAKIHANDRC